ncbi:MAG: hypothetical protein KAH22_11760 [Thiotrichaceae bacterium]|nr:hypothetical protein [Thiotrichaceae bacterium]
MTTPNTHLLVVAHGSRREASNEELRTLCKNLTVLDHPYSSISSGFLELAEPSIPDGLRQLIASNAKDITVVPYFLSAGRHVIVDIPAEIAIVRKEFPEINISLAPYFGASQGIASLLLEGFHETNKKPINKKNNSDLEDYFANISQELTTLQRGNKLLERAAEQGFDWADWRPVIDKVNEEVAEIIEAVENKESIERVEEELGDLFMIVNNLARHLKVNPENAAHLSNEKFARRFNQMMQVTKENHPESDKYTVEQMNHSWEVIKKREKNEFT